MSAEQILQKKIISNSSLHQVIRSEVRQHQGKQEGLTIPVVAVYLSPLGFMFVWVVFFLILQKIRNMIENKMTFTMKTSHKVPCKNCKYYANNHYIKCAVQPSIVLTEAAQDCSEYSSKKSGFFSKNILKKNNYNN
ncbi:hypothetical protein [Fortiea contorta]|uniref:hypothetical protein n=1 Tax=Fortiea contorta TaxID=1892405 RepID=UPI00036E911A|nr:hypothetical protein [Fortiea contorta]